VDVATAVVACLEEHGAFDAGRGAMLNQDGVAELDAGIMDGATLAYGSVIAIQNVPTPVRVARRLMSVGEGRVRILAGHGAERFAAAEGFALVDPDALICERERARYQRLHAQAGRFHPSTSFVPGAVGGSTPGQAGGHDTVGCVVRDAEGHLAAATSTGGTPFKPPGRVGDSPLPGSGFYATEHAAASATGWGEAIAAVVLASRATGDVARGQRPEAVARERLAEMHARILNPDGHGAAGGLLLLDTAGRGAYAFSTPRMARAGWHQGGSLWVDLSANDEGAGDASDTQTP
jgi:beta-aspartyl-peptidase (threonine type)